MAAAPARPRTVGEELRDTATALAAIGIEAARLEARLLVARALEADWQVVAAYPEREMPAAARERLRLLTARRIRREPMSHILGQREFWGLDFAVTADVLTPRPDSETLIEAALELRPDRLAAYRALDLGTGSGCLLLAFLSERPNATGLGVDASPAALEVARRNGERLGLAGRARFIRGDWCAGLEERFDLVLANPPYIPTARIDGLEPEVARYEPRGALDGGPDGLEAYRTLASQLPAVLQPGGVVLFEVGEGQAAAVAGLAAASGLKSLGTRRDLAGIERCVVAGA